MTRGEARRAKGELSANGIEAGVYSPAGSWSSVPVGDLGLDVPGCMVVVYMAGQTRELQTLEEVAGFIAHIAQAMRESTA